MSENTPLTGPVAAPAATKVTDPNTSLEPSPPNASNTANAPTAPNASTTSNASTAPAAMPELTNAQKKERAKAEKLARRGQKVASKVAQPKPDAPAAKGPKKTATATGGPTPIPANAQKPEGPKIPDAYSHLSIAKKLPLSKADKDVHPSVLAIGQQMASFTLKDNAARLEAMLVAFKKVGPSHYSSRRSQLIANTSIQVIDSYEAPPGQTFVRTVLGQCLNPQIDYLIACRPMCFSMGNAIRMLKARIAALIELNVPDEEAKRSLHAAIEVLISERIDLAQAAIVEKTVKIIEDGENILTYGHARLVQLSLQKAHAEGRKFEVTVVDDPWDPSGEELAKILRNDGITVNYFPDTSIGNNIDQITKFLIGAEAMFANGYLYAAAGTRQLVLEANMAEIPVTALLETINCDRERVSVDTMTHNEIDPEACTADLFRLLFDTTPGKDIFMVMTEDAEANASGTSSSILPVLKRLDERFLNGNWH